MKLPKKITPCPIVEAIIEIRFESDLPGDAVFGIAYNAFKNEYSSVKKLPISQIPETIRSKDANLIFSPHYSLQKENFSLQIGPKVFSLANTKEYSGWGLFSEKAYEVFNKILQLEIVKQIIRIGLRYVNIFEDLDIYKKSKLKMILHENSFNASKLNLTAEVSGDNCVHLLKMINNAEVMIENNTLSGSIIDIDTIPENFSGSFFDNMKEFIEKAHVEEKKLFFSLLKDDFLESLNPEY